jgi:proton glutamate symport protein
MSKTTIIFLALVGGLIMGGLIGEGVATAAADVVGALWLNGLRMTVVPLVVALLITGVAQTAEAARAGRLAMRAVITMMAVLWCSSIVAAVMMPALLAAFPMPEGAAAALREALSTAAKPAAVPPLGDFLRPDQSHFCCRK